MGYDERVGLYMSGLAGSGGESDFEDDLLSDDGLLERFIESCEKAAQAPPPGFAGMVMNGVGPLALPTLPKAPLLSRRLCAAVCFSSAAAIALITLAGFDWYVFDFLSGQSGKLFDLVGTIIS